MSVRKSAWVFGVPGYLTIEYESGKKPDTTGAPSRPRSEPRSGFGIGRKCATCPLPNEPKAYTILTAAEWDERIWASRLSVAANPTGFEPLAL